MGKAIFGGYGVACAMAMLVLGHWTGSAAAQPAGFREFEGSWAGSGSISRADGRTERLRCGADYTARGDVLSQRLRCRSDSTGFDLVNTLRNEGGRLSGEWSETSRNVRGALVGSLGQGAMQGTAQGPGFSAGISVTVRGNRQSVAIRAQGGDITAVNIALVKGR